MKIGRSTLWDKMELDKHLSDELKQPSQLYIYTILFLDWGPYFRQECACLLLVFSLWMPFGSLGILLFILLCCPNPVLWLSVLSNFLKITLPSLTCRVGLDFVVTGWQPVDWSYRNTFPMPEAGRQFSPAKWRIQKLRSFTVSGKTGRTEFLSGD